MIGTVIMCERLAQLTCHKPAQHVCLVRCLFVYLILFVLDTVRYTVHLHYEYRLER